MRLLFFCPRWGQSHIPWDAFANKVKQAGYDGIETDIPTDPAEKTLLLTALEKYDLQLIAQHWETICRDFHTHKKEYATRLEQLAAVKPLFINSQTGKDYYPFEQNEPLLAIGKAITVANGIPVYHETHRGKFSFAAHITRQYLQQLDYLSLTLDISHWCAVAETLLDDQLEAVQLAISRTNHIHARVGHTQGPQVSDPRAPEWGQTLQFHLGCWDAVIAHHRKTGTDRLSFTMEFGPWPYMPQQPYTRQPIADQWEVNLYMKELLKTRYKQPQPGLIPLKNH